MQVSEERGFLLREREYSDDDLAAHLRISEKLLRKYLENVLHVECVLGLKFRAATKSPGNSRDFSGKCNDRLHHDCILARSQCNGGALLLAAMIH